MKKILLLSLLLVSSFGFGQEAVIEWQKSIGGSSQDYSNSVQQTSDGGYIIAGRSVSNNGDVTGNHGNFDYWVAKLDASGNITWQKSLGGSGNEEAWSVQQTSDGGYIIAGRSNSNDGDVTGSHGYDDCWIVKLDVAGNIIWQKSLGGSLGDFAKSIRQTTDGGYILAGESRSVDGDVTGNHGTFDYWVVKLDTAGNIVWQKSLGGSQGDFAYSVKQTSDGGYVVAGTSSSVDGDVTGNHGSGDFWVVKLDATGNITWQKALGGTNYEEARSIEQTSDGGYIIAGHSDSNNGDVSGFHGAYDYWVVKLDISGNIIWQKSLGGSGDDRARSVKQTSNGGYIVAGLSNSNNGDITGNRGYFDSWTVKLDTFGNISWQRSFGGSGADRTYSIENTSDGGYIFSGHSDSNNGDVTGNNGGRDYWVVKLITPNVQGRVYNDLNDNCIHENIEVGLEGISVTISPGGYITQSVSNGLWSLDSLPIGTYTATVDTTNLNWTPTCPVSQTFTVTDPMSYTPGPQFGLINNNACSSPDISIYAPFLRRCFSDQVIYVKACNEITGTSALTTAYVEVELDSHLTPTSSSLPYTSLANNTYKFDLGDLYPNRCINFTINTTVDCNALLGETLCMDATLYPVDSCALDSIPANPLPPTFGNDPNLVMPQPCTLPWDNSSLQVQGWCQGDSVHFSITNTGDLGNGDMDCYSPVLLYINDTLVAIDSVQLQGQQTIYFSYPANGETWILAAEQHPLHPGNSHPNAHVELCGSDSTQWIPGLVNNHPLDDADPIVDIYCGAVTGSYDPNDKIGFPHGVTDQNHIQANQHLQYVVRFQNTGADTAFNVVIRDTLDTDLNIFTVTPGVSSHNYTFRKYGPRVLEWTFDNILLPDSTTNEPESNGFVTFTVDLVPNLPNGTLINNQADIYFDFNAPIITNETAHRINDMIASSPLKETVLIEVVDCSSYTWSTNGQTYTQSGQYAELFKNQLGFDSTVILDLTINQPTASSEVLMMCDNYTWSADGQTYNQSGTYTTVLTNQAGCDSTVTLDLTITNSNSSTETIVACNNYTWSTNGQTYTQSGQYLAVLTNQAGCDSTVTLNLTVNQATNGNETVTSCDTYIWNADGQTYNQSGTYTTLFTNQAGCDSTVTLDLTITNSNSSAETVAACNNYTWSTSGQTYTQSGQYTEVLTNQAGCDSTAILNLTVNQPNAGSEIVTSCDSYYWSADGQTYNQSGSYTTILTNTEGCDSTVTLDLTINTVINAISQLDDITLKADASNAQYQWVDCDLNYQIIPGETGQTFQATANGVYAALVTKNGCTDTTDCITINKLGLQEITNQTLKVYPNPTAKTFTISSDKVINSTFKLIDAQGRKVLSGEMDGKEQTIDISKLSKGVYSVVFDNSELPVLSVIKE